MTRRSPLRNLLINDLYPERSKSPPLFFVAEDMRRQYAERGTNHLPALKEINYEGTIAQWESVSKSDEWNKYIVHCTDGDIIPAN